MTSAKPIDPTQLFIDKVIDHFQEIIADQHNRVKELESGNLTDERIKELLNKGIWTPSKYHEMLKKFQKKERLQWLVRTGGTYHGFIDSKVFTKIPDETSPSGYKLMEFALNTGNKPSDALKVFKEKVCCLDCKITLQIAVLNGFKDIVGDKEFDYYLSHLSPFKIGAPLDFVISNIYKVVQLKDESEIKRGDIRTISNIKIDYGNNRIFDYASKHPAGEVAAFNLICCSDDAKEKKYLGFELSSEGETTQQIEKRLFDGINQDPFGKEFVSSQIWEKLYPQRSKFQTYEDLLDAAKKIKFSWEHFKELREKDSKNFKVFRPNRELIEKLYSLSKKNS